MINPVITNGMSGGIGAYVSNMRMPFNADSTDSAQRIPGADDYGQNTPFGEQGIQNDADRKRRFDSYECRTCENRKYQDGSTDSGVSFQTPTKIAPEAAAVAVRGHEMEHVVRNQAKAEREDREVVSQSVTLHTAVCPECGRVYISGGTTRTTTRAENNAEKFGAGTENGRRKGESLDMAV